jgi:hypothetical protein
MRFNIPTCCERMLVVLSPAKTLTVSSLRTPCIRLVIVKPGPQIDAAARAAAATTPRFIKDADALASSLGRLSSSALSSLFGVSSAIGTLNEGRFNSWSSDLDGPHGVAAGVAMDGPAFKTLDLRSLSSLDRESAAKRGNDARFGEPVREPTLHQSSSSLECTDYCAFLTGYSPTVSKWALLDSPSTVYARMQATLCTFQMHLLAPL